jgi:ankyrin repeat protein
MRRGIKNRAVSPSDRALRSAARKNASTSDLTAGSLISRTNLLSLPNETLVSIAKLSEENDQWALCLVNRRLNNVATSVLWNTLYNDPRRCKEVLLWCIEHGRNDLLKDLLDRKVSPRFLYLSSLLGSRLRDVLRAQGRRGAVGPRDDRRLHEEMFREKYCRSAVIRNRVRHARSKAGLDLQITDDDMDWNLTDGWFEHTCSLRHFGISEVPEVNDRQYWYWAPIHLAAMTHNNTALRMLLDSGADIDAQCSGLCDCAAPAMDGEDDLEASVAPHRGRSVWTALHVAMCSGNEEAVRLLISKGISINVGSLIRRPYSAHWRSRLAIHALQDAAWLGSIPMCRILLDDPRTKHYVDVSNRRWQTAVHYAAAGGHIRTVGKFLLQNGAKFHFYDNNPGHGLRFDPLRQLCTMHRFEDARWLLDLCRRKLYPGRPAEVVYTRALASLCYLSSPAEFSRLSLRQQQDRLYDLTPEKIRKLEIDRVKAARQFQCERVSLAKRLLVLGADPNEPERIYHGQLPTVVPFRNYEAGDHYRTALQLAAMSGFTKMINLLLSKGADVDKIGTRLPEEERVQKPLDELPLMCAIRHALHRARYRCHLGQDPGDLSSVQALLDAGCSMADRGDQSVLTTLESFKMLCYDRRPFFDKVWLSIAEKLLGHGAATATADSKWEEVVGQACVPGSLAFCKMLEVARPIHGFSWTTHVQMVRQAIFGYAGRCPEGTPEDLELVSWALRQCLNCDRRMTRFKSAFPSLIERARKEGKNQMADVVEDFITDMPDTPTPVKRREVSPELGMPSPSDSEMDFA